MAQNLKIYKEWKDLLELFLYYEKEPIDNNYISEQGFQAALNNICKTPDFFISFFVKDHKVKLDDLKKVLSMFLPIYTCPKKYHKDMKGKIDFDTIKILLDSLWFFMTKEEGEKVLKELDQFETPFYVYPKGKGEFTLVIKTMTQKREVNIKSTGTEIFIDTDLTQPKKGSIFGTIMDIIKARFQFSDQQTGFYLKEFPISKDELERCTISNDRLSKIEFTSENSKLIAILDKASPVVLKKLVPTAKTIHQVLWNPLMTSLKLFLDLSKKNAYILSIKGVYQHEGEYYLVSEMELGTLTSESIFDPKIQVEIAHQLASALHFLNNEQSRIHLDLLPSNIFLCPPKDNVSKYRVCISGFQNNIQFTSSQIQKDSKVSEPRFYSINSPPESFEDKIEWKPSDYLKANIYSFGCVLYEMISGKHPFKKFINLNDQEKYKQMKLIFKEHNVETLFLNDFKSLASELFKIQKLDTTKAFLEIIKGCLCFDASQRWTWAKILGELENLKKSFKDLPDIDPPKIFTKEEVFEYLKNSTQVPEKILQNILTSEIDGIKFFQLTPEKLDSIGIKMIKFQAQILQARDQLFNKNLNPSVKQNEDQGYSYK